MKRTVLALLLAVFMAATLMTVGAAAEGKEAPIGSTEYATLTEALSNAQSGDTVRLLKDIDNSIDAEGYKGGINYSLKAGVTLDGAGHTISGHIGVWINAARRYGEKRQVQEHPQRCRGGCRIPANITAGRARPATRAPSTPPA